MGDAKEINSLKIYRQGVLAGHLSRTSDGCEFVFDEGFFQNPKFKGLSFSMPKTRTPYRIQGVNLHSFFAGLLPEGLRLQSLQTNLKTSKDDLFTLFASISAYTVGDVHAEIIAHGKRDFPKLKEIDFYEYFKELTSINSYTAMGEDALAGVQEKASASVISFPLNIAKADRSYILKLNPKDKPNLVDNELHSMRLAHLCGFKTAKVKIVRDKSGNHGLLVERFDRIKVNDQLTMLHQEDFCQVMGKYPQDKYRLSLREMIEGVKPFVTAEQVSILKILKIYCFSYLLGNGDMHAKNLSLITSEHGITDLTPAYDLLTTYIFGDRHMACKLDGRDANIKRRHVLDFGKRQGLPEPVIGRMLDALVKDFSKNYQILSNIPMEERQWVNLEKMIHTRLSDLKA